MPLQPWNARSPIDIRQSGNIISVKPLQLLNASFPIFVKPFGNVMLVTPLQEKNASSAIASTLYTVEVKLTVSGITRESKYP
jgi:hypothetical protein